MIKFSRRCDSGLVQTILHFSFKTQNELPHGHVIGKTNRLGGIYMHSNNLISVANLRTPREREGRDKES